VIKRLCFANRREGLLAADFVTTWRDALTAFAAAPIEVRPSRVTISSVLPEFAETSPLHDVVVGEWFVDGEHLSRYTEWRDATHAEVKRSLMEVCASAPVPTLVADVRIMRGVEWLNDRWARGGVAVKHVAFAIGAEHLSASEFSRNWQAHAGTVTGSRGGAVTIPDVARGSAYVQNQLECDATDGYDAVTEVYFDDLDGLRARVDWFAANFDSEAQRDLFASSWFVALTEESLTANGSRIH
jgi:hypothetical protein